MKKAKRLQKVLIVAMGVLITVGCQKSSNGLSESSLSSSLSACSSASAKVDLSQLDISGGKSALPGDPVRYSLNQDLSCDQGKTVSWKAIGSGTTLSSSGQTLVSSYNKTGEYVVTATVSSSTSPDLVQVSSTTVVSLNYEIIGPDVGMAEFTHHFELSVPSDGSPSLVTWNFGDGSPEVTGASPADHTFWSAGTYEVHVAVVDASGETSNLTHVIQVLPALDGLQCVRDLAVSGPTEAPVNSPITMSVYIPTCMTSVVRSLTWNFGDNTATAGGQTVSHTYTTAGTYTVRLDIYTSQSSTTPLVSLTRTISVNESVPPDPVPTPDPTPVPIPGQCSVLGQTRSIDGDIYTEEESCGVNGHKTMSYRDVITEECKKVAEGQKWVETLRDKQLLNEGECQGQACELPELAMTGVDNVAMDIVQIGGKYYLLDGGSKTLYSTQSPSGQCSEVAALRTCSNGVLGGSTSNVYLLCNNGCPGVGPHGTTLVGVITGETSVAKTCAYGETGIFDIFNLISDKTCNRGQVTVSNTRQGDLKTAGLCPTYQWSPTEMYSACSSACGGEQTRVYECRSNDGVVAPNERCQGTAPVETRLCDGDPDSVRRSESSVEIETGGSSTTCPANQIGAVVSKREVTTIKTYACIEHSVQLENEHQEYGPWLEERYCKDFVAHRCSGDSLGAMDAKKRYQWMLKCRSQIPAIEEFLQIFTKYQHGSGGATGLMLNGKTVYATFMDGAFNPPRTWKAPVYPSSPCEAPATVYVAAVCVASCATPEQMILAASEETSGKLQYVRIYNAWDEKFKSLATLRIGASLSSTRLEKTAVDQWVTELEDGEHDILVFKMKSGREIRVTPNHPLVTDQGTLKAAGDFAVGENLIELGGKHDPVAKITAVKHFGKVYNVFVRSTEPEKNIMVLNGYLNGTAYFQNDGADLLNREILRSRLTKGAIK